jgi:long-chain acyl-CoA synthetase
MTEHPPRLASLPEYLAHHAATCPSREAACDERASVTYGELDRLATAFAEALRSRGITAGQRVAFQGPPGLPFWVCLLGTQRAGAVWLGLNPSYTTRELVHVLQDASPVLTLTALEPGAGAHAALRAACAEAGRAEPVALDVDHLALPHSVHERESPPGTGGAPDRMGDVDRTSRVSPADAVPTGVSLIVYTSGSTGAPKGAMLTADGLVENGWWLASRMDFAPVRGLVNLPVNHIGCVGDLCATLLVAGGTAVFMARFDAAAAVERIVASRVEWLPQVPAQFQLMAAHGGLSEAALRSIRHLTWGGAAMPAPLIQQLRGWVPDLFNSYGLTECTGTITLTRPGATLKELSETVGQPVAADRLRIAGDDGASLPPGAVGEVQIRGAHVFRGYLNRDAGTAGAFTPDGWLRTGDLGSLDPQGNLCLRGRTHEMFKSGGYNVYPREVETVIESMGGVELCAVVAVPDPLWGEVGVAFVQADPQRVQPEALRAHCLSLLARYKVPKRFVVRQALPLLPIGKVDKVRLKDEAAADGGD